MDKHGETTGSGTKSMYSKNVILFNIILQFILNFNDNARIDTCQTCPLNKVVNSSVGLEHWPGTQTVDD